MTHALIMAEGTAEQAILEILLENDYLAVSVDELVTDKWVIPKLMKGKDLAEKYLQRDFGTEGLELIVVLDSIKREIKLPFVYQRQVRTTRYYVTRPEIEAIQLYAEKKWRPQYDVFRAKNRTGDQKDQKPSAFFRASPSSGGLGIRNVKSYDFVHRLWRERPDELVVAILRVKHDIQKSGGVNGRYTLAELLRPDLQFGW
ncbi:MAG: hypothetical protein LKJ69_03060 [Lactobacillus sp.]|jgi:hypothetical protein|nr:hypothetical protein [Lactobacillus sp.]MCI2032359.1 hypothetical protein [Lactobacillus sp.]